MCCQRVKPCQKHHCTVCNTDRQRTQAEVLYKTEVHPKACFFLQSLLIAGCCGHSPPMQVWHQGSIRAVLLHAQRHRHKHTHYLQGCPLTATCLRQVALSPLHVDTLSHGPLGRLRDKAAGEAHTQLRCDSCHVTAAQRYTNPVLPSPTVTAREIHSCSPHTPIFWRPSPPQKICPAVFTPSRSSPHTVPAVKKVSSGQTPSFVHFPATSQGPAAGLQHAHRQGNSMSGLCEFHRHANQVPSLVHTAATSHA
jgi:hypothetical protein